MIATFADSSALVKLYADEPNTEAIRGTTPLVVSQVARVEVPAAIWRKHRVGELSAAEANILVSEFEADYFGTDEEDARFVVIAVTNHILDAAAHLSGARGLRAYDAVQLASACSASAAVTGELAFAAFDKTLREAAAAEGSALFPA